jgi:hypothetical protein
MTAEDKALSVLNWALYRGDWCRQEVETMHVITYIFNLGIS